MFLLLSSWFILDFSYSALFIKITLPYFMRLACCLLFLAYILQRLYVYVSFVCFLAAFSFFFRKILYIYTCSSSACTCQALRTAATHSAAQQLRASGGPPALVHVLVGRCCGVGCCRRLARLERWCPDPGCNRA